MEKRITGVLKRPVVLVLSLMMMLSMAPLKSYAAFDENGELIPTDQRFTVVQEDRNKYNTFYVTEKGVGTFPVYCFNNSLHWPEFGDDNVVKDEFSPRDFSKLTEGLDAETAAAAQEALRRVLYAGWPNNGAGLYDDETNTFIGSVEFTLADFNRLLNDWSPAAKVLLKNKGYDVDAMGPLELRADSTMPAGQYEFLRKLVTEMLDWDSTWTDEELSVMSNSGNWDCLNTLDDCIAYLDDFDADSIIALYTEMYMPTAHSATQDAIWMIQKHFGIRDNNNKVTETPEVLLLVDYALNPGKYPAIPTADTYENDINEEVQLRESADPAAADAPVVKLTRNPADGKYYSQELIIHSQKEKNNPDRALYNATYTVKYNGELAAQTVKNDEPFTLKLDNPPAYGSGVIEIDTDLKWPSKVYAYGTDKKADDGKGYQTMGGLYIREKELATNFNYEVEDLGELTLKKLVLEEDSRKAFKDLKFTFYIQLKDYQITDADGKPEEGTFDAIIRKINDDGSISNDKKETTVKATSNGKITVQLAMNELIEIKQLPIGLQYEITEAHHENWVHTHINNKGETSLGIVASAQNEYKYNAISTKLEGKKLLLRDGEPIETKTGAYRFEMYPEDNASPMPQGSEVNDNGTPVAIATNSANGHFAFGNISYSRPGVHKYIIQEKDTGVPGVSYDSNSYLATVTVDSDGNGKLVTDIKYEYLDSDDPVDADAALFTNTYDQNKVTQTISVDKHVQDDTNSGKTHSLAGYQFKIEPNPGATDNPDKYPEFTQGNTSTTITTDALGTATSNALTFDEKWFEKYTNENGDPVVLNYTIKEVGNMPAGITKDSKTVTVEITVTRIVEEGKQPVLASAIKYDGGITIPEFSNTYEVSGSFDLNVDKSFKPTSYKPEDGDVYKFAVACSDDCETTGEITLTYDKNKNNGNGGFVASNNTLTIHKAGHHDLIVKELPSNATNVIDDSSVWKVHVDAEDKGQAPSGKLDITAVKYEDAEGNFNDSSAAFVNQYFYDPKEVGVTATKELVGEGAPALEPGQFAFVMTAANKHNPMPANSALNADGLPAYTTHNKADGTIDFGTINFTEEGVYEYYLKEKPVAAANIEEDATVWTVRITVEAENGFLSNPKVEYIKGGTSRNAAVFSNKYLQDSIKRRITVHKAIEDLAEGGKAHNLSGYEFTVAPAETGDALNKYPAFTADGASKVTITSNTNGNAVTPYLTFDEAWFNANSNNGMPINLKYTIKETGTTPSYITNDDKVVNVNVLVSKHITNGVAKLSSSIVYDNSTTAPTFTNKYTSQGEVELKVNKSFTPAAYTPAEGTKFNFSVTDEEGEEVSTITLEANGQGGFKNQVGGKFAVDKAGTFNYKIKELVPEGEAKDDNMSYDATEWNARVIVKDNGSGELSAASVSYTTKDGKASADAAEFVNGYTFDDVSATITASKKYVGDGAPALKKGAFSFVIYPKDGTADYPMPALSAANKDGRIEKIVKNGTADSNSAISFGTIKYNQVGEYEYILEELETGAANVSKDNSYYLVKVTVTSNGTALNTPTVKYYRNGKELDKEPDFENEYTQGEVKQSFTVKKAINDNAEGGHKLSLEGYTFEIKPAPAEGETDAKYPEFLMSKSTSTTMTTDANGIAVTDEILIDEAAFDPDKDNDEITYKYTITETKMPEGASDNGITMSGEQPIQVVVKATKKLAGDHKYDLATTVTYNNAIDVPQVTNQYNASGSTVLNLAKKFNYDYYWPTAGDEFTFELACEDETVETNNITLVADGKGGFTKKNSTDGKVSFTKAGDYSVTITEAGADTDSMKYDKASWTATFTVVDDGKGNLKVDDSGITYAKGTGYVANKATFTNKYSFDAVYAELTASKVLTGPDGTWAPELKAGQFKFELSSDDDTNPMPETAENGKIVRTNGTGTTSVADVNFGKIKFTEAGTYVYTIRELDTDMKAVDKDTTKYKAVVTIAEPNGTKLSAPVVKYYKDYVSGIEPGTTAKFINTYNQTSVDAHFGAMKLIDDTTDGGFKHSVEGYKFTIEPEEVTDAYPALDGDGNKSITITTDANGKAETVHYDFDEEWFDKYSKDGEPVVLNYTMRETSEAPAGITNDTKVINIKVTVTRLVDAKGNVELKSKVTYDSDDAEPYFTNTYAADGDAELEVVKAFKSKKYKPAKGEKYTFKVTAGDASLTAADIVLTADGKGGWTKTGGQITFTKAGVHHFIIGEVKGKIKGMKYDKTLWNAEVVVEDAGDGTLKVASITYRNAKGKVSEKAAKFVNEPENGVDTGDSTKLGLYIMGLITSLGGALAIVFRRRRTA